MRHTPLSINKTKTIPEIFDQVRSVEDRKKKVEILRAYDTKAMRFVINLMYNVDLDGIKIPNFIPNHRPVGNCNLSINTSVNRLEKSLSFKDTKPEILEKNLLLVLEEVSAAESELLVSILTGKKVAGISKSMFSEAYPDMFRFRNEDKESETDSEV